ncbi:MAG: hypothetical protein SVK08_02015 [Halobacteriota archaeon]|nr:hypothetical protein [Halobacteriota archaeon]
MLEEAVRENNYSAGTSPPAGKSNQDEFLFQDPKEYEKMTPEERKAKSEKMMKFWKGQHFAGVG